MSTQNSEHILHICDCFHTNFSQKVSAGISENPKTNMHICTNYLELMTAFRVFQERWTNVSPVAKVLIRHYLYSSVKGLFTI